jgi:hypothetical protein
MFDFLDDLTASQAIPAGYYAIQFIRQWAKAQSPTAKYAAFDTLPPSEADLAKRIVNEIESRECQPVTALPSSKIDDYIKIIAGKLQDLSRRDWHADQAKGEILLQQLRLAS